MAHRHWDDALDAIRRGEPKIVLNQYEFEYDGVELEALDAAVAVGGAGITHFGVTRPLVEDWAQFFDAVGNTLARCPCLRTLVLRDVLWAPNHAEDDEGTPGLVRAVTKILREHPLLTELDLVGNDLDLPTVSAMLAAAGGVGALQRLRLGFNSMGVCYTGGGVHPLDTSVLFGILPRLTVLDVSDSHFDENILLELVTLATASTRIRELNVGGNYVESAAVYDALSVLVSELGPKTLVRLDVPVAGVFLAKLTAFIVSAVANPRLEHLGFAGMVPISDPEFAGYWNPLAFPFDALFEPRQVKSLRMFRVALTPSSCAELFAAIARSSSITTLSLVDLGFRAAEWRALGSSLTTTTDATMGCGVQSVDLGRTGDFQSRLRPFWDSLRVLACAYDDGRHNFALRRVYPRTFEDPRNWDAVSLPLVPLQEVALQDHYRAPHVRFVARTRVLCQAGRARAGGAHGRGVGVGVEGVEVWREGRGEGVAWLCERAPLWVVVHVCALLRDAEEGPWQRARLRADGEDLWTGAGGDGGIYL